MRWLIIAWFALALVLVGCSGTSDSGGDGTAAIEWAASVAPETHWQLPEHFGFGIGIGHAESSDTHWLTDGTLDDYKPVYSPDGSQIVFFRVYEYLDTPVPDWRTKICVINADGSGFRELTGGEYSDFIPYWTRDGTNEITFTRFAIPFSQRIYRTTADAEPGDEQLISAPENFEHGYTTLEDGRMLVRREIPIGYFLMTPNPGGTPTYEAITHPGDEGTYMHKMTVSPSETKVAYMKIENRTLGDIVAQRVYMASVIAYADFDPVNLRIENEVEITELDESTLVWYPAWTADEKHILYAHHDVDGRGVIKAYSLDTGETTQISSDDELNYRYPVPVGIAK